MADRPSDSPEFKKKQAMMVAENAGDAVGAGIGKAVKTWMFYDPKKGRIDPIGGLISLSIVSCVTGFAYDLGNDMFFPDPGHDKALEQSIRLGERGQGYQAVIARPGSAPVVLVRTEGGAYQLYREENGREGQRELTLISNRAEAAALMAQIAQDIGATAAGAEFTPYELRYEDVSAEYKDHGDVQRLVTRSNRASQAGFSPEAAQAISQIWNNAAQSLRDGTAEYGVTPANAGNLQEEADFDKNFGDGWKYSMLGFLGLRLLSGTIGGVATGVSVASAGRRRRKAMGLERR